jgi:hypothetical protein
MKITEENHPELHCPVCGGLLIHENDIKDNQYVDCKWRCISPSCRKERGMGFNIYYGYTQEDINGQANKYVHT